MSKMEAPLWQTTMWSPPHRERHGDVKWEMCCWAALHLRPSCDSRSWQWSREDEISSFFPFFVAYLPLTTKQVTRKMRRTIPPAMETARMVDWLGSPIAKTSVRGEREKREHGGLINKRTKEDGQKLSWGRRDEGRPRVEKTARWEWQRRDGERMKYDSYRKGDKRQRLKEKGKKKEQQTSKRERRGGGLNSK